MFILKKYLPLHVYLVILHCLLITFRKKRTFWRQAWCRFLHNWNIYICASLLHLNFSTCFSVVKEKRYNDMKAQFVWCISQNTSSLNKELKMKKLAAVEYISTFFFFFPSKFKYVLQKRIHKKKKIIEF